SIRPRTDCGSTRDSTRSRTSRSTASKPARAATSTVSPAVSPRPTARAFHEAYIDRSSVGGGAFLVVKRFPVVGDRSRSFGSRDHGGWMKPADQLSTIAANPPASPLAQLRERNKIYHSLPAVRRKLIEGTSRGAGPSTV